MENIDYAVCQENTFGSLAIYNIYYSFSGQKVCTEFCFVPKQILWGQFDYNEWLKLINNILCIILKTPPTGSQGTYTKVELNILNKRFVEPGEKLIGAENIFNYRNQYIHGQVKIINSTTSETGFVALDVEFKLYNELGSARFKIMQK